MAGTRGSIPRRKPDPSRRPAPRADDQSERQPRGGSPMFYDVGKVAVPPDGTVSVFSYRFPCAGRVRDASIRIAGAPLNSGLSVAVSANGQNIFSAPWPDTHAILKVPDALSVDEYTFLAVSLSRAGGVENMEVNADIAFIFQEHARAAVPRPI